MNEIKVPVKFKKYFWGVDFDKLDLVNHRKFILTRFLNYGNFESFPWIFKTFTASEVNELINKNGKYSLSRNSFLFWKKIAKEEKYWEKIKMNNQWQTTNDQ